MKNSSNCDTLAEDVQQQVFIEANRDLSRFAGRSTLRTWLFAIAKHRVLDAIRKRRRERVLLGPKDAGVVPDPDWTSDERLDDERIYNALIECMQSADLSIQAMVLLRFQRGFTYEELAAVLGARPDAMRARMKRALPALRARMEDRLGARWLDSYWSSAAT